MTVEEAVEAARWRHLQNPTEPNIPHTCDDELRLAGRFPPEIVQGLREPRHQVNITGDWAGTGSEVMIEVDLEEGILACIVVPRRGHYDIGW